MERFLGLETVAVEPLDVAMVQRAHELLNEYPHVGIGGRDASLVAAMERREVSDLWTHDGGLKRLGTQVDWLAVTDPVEQTLKE